MDTKSLIIDIATKLFQQKGYKSVGLNELLKACNVTKGALYHHFPNGKEELLISCLQSFNEAISGNIEEIFERYATTLEATLAMLEKLITNLEVDGTTTGYTLSSIISEMASLSDSVQSVCADFYRNIQSIYHKKLVADGYSDEIAHSIAIMMMSSVEGGMMLCLTQNSTDPLRVVAQALPNMMKGF